MKKSIVSIVSHTDTEAHMCDGNVCSITQSGQTLLVVAVVREIMSVYLLFHIIYDFCFIVYEGVARIQTTKHENMKRDESIHTT